MFGFSLSQDAISEIRQLKGGDRSSRIYEALQENGCEHKFAFPKQTQVAMQILNILVDNKRIDISGSEIKSIIKMCSNIW